MQKKIHAPFLTGSFIIWGLLFCNSLWSQTSDTTQTINIPLPYEDLSLYDFAEVRFETDKTEVPPADIFKRNFQPVKEIFQKDSLHFDDSVQSAWFKFTVRNNLSTDTSVALVFLEGVSKAVLYKKEGEKIILVGKTGWSIAVIVRTIPYELGRIDVVLKAHSQINYFIQIPRIGFNVAYILYKKTALESVAYAEIKAFNREKEVNRPNFLWLHFFTGIFFMFFVFGFIKYLVFGKDKAYLYYSLMGLCAALATIALSEYPPLELPWFENLRGIDVFNLVRAVSFIMQGLFILEILQLKIKYPRITRVIKWYFLVKFLIVIINTTIWNISQKASVFEYLELYDKFLFHFLMIGWVVYLATIRKGFYRFIFLGALTILTAYTLMFIVMFFELHYLLPSWFGADQHGGVYHFMSIALVIDMCFYFTGLAYRDKQVEKDKIIFQEELKVQKLESEKTKAELMHQASELEMQALRAQMNPHFVFNSLNSINMFILENDKLQASEYLSKFSRLVRLILQNSQEALIPLEKELEALQLYLELESLRFENKFEYKITVDDDVDTTMLKVPPLIIQPYAENAIWHGLMHKKNTGHLEIKLCLEDSMLLCAIMDDGVGRKKAAELKNKATSIHKSMGMRITASRIAILQQQEPEINFISITDLVLPDGSPGGTKVLIKIPLHYD